MRKSALESKSYLRCCNGSLANLKRSLIQVLQAFPGFYQNNTYPVLTIHPAFDQTPLFFKFHLINCKVAVAPSPILSSLVREILGENILEIQGPERLTLRISSKQSTPKNVQQAQAFLRQKFPNQFKLTGFDKTPIVLKKDYESDIALEAVASNLLRHGDITLADYLDVLLPQIVGQKTVILAHNTRNALFMADYLTAFGKQVAVIMRSDSIITRKANVTKLKQGLVSILILEIIQQPDDREFDNHIPDELLLLGIPFHDEIVDLSQQAYLESDIDWHRLTDATQIIKYYPACPTSDELLDLFHLNKSLKSNKLGNFLQEKARTCSFGLAT